MAVVRGMASGSLPQKAAAVMEATSPASHKKPTLSSTGGLLAKLIMVMNCLWG